MTDKKVWPSHLNDATTVPVEQHNHVFVGLDSTAGKLLDGYPNYETLKKILADVVLALGYGLEIECVVNETGFYSMKVILVRKI